MRVRAWPVLIEAVDGGVARGWYRAHKHDDHPTEEAIREAIADAVTSAICEWFDVDPEPDDS